MLNSKLFSNVVNIPLSDPHIKHFSFSISSSFNKKLCISGVLVYVLGQNINFI